MDELTLKKYLDIQPSIPKFPLTKPWTFRNGINGILPGKPVLDTGFSAAGMVGRGKEPTGYGIADLSDILDRNNNGTVQVSNDEYMSRLTGIPSHLYEKFRRHTNNSRASLPYATQFLAPQPNSINIRATNDPNGASFSLAADRKHTFAPYVSINNGQQVANADDPNIDILATLPYNGHIKYPAVKKVLLENGHGIILIKPRHSQAVINKVWDRQIRNKDKDLTTFYDTLKHEVSHQNTAENVNDITTLLPGIKPLTEWYQDMQRKYPLLTKGSPKVPSGVQRDLNVFNMYDLFSPKDSFMRETYFGDVPAESWGAANRIKNDGAGLFYKKYGRMPGFDDSGEPITGLQKINDIKEAVRLFHKENPGRYTEENMRVRNLEESPEDITEWMLRTPAYDYQTDDAPTGLTMWDLAYNNNGRMNKYASANIAGLYKAASEVKQAGKIMKVKVSKQMRGNKGWRGMAQFVYMPDCEKYRDIINNGSGEQQAELANKFILNQKPDMVWTSCELEIVEK